MVRVGRSSVYFAGKPYLASRRTWHEGVNVRRLIVKTRLTGHFQGFATDQVLELQNGETWQQDAVKRRYAYRYRPKATLWEESKRYYMDIEGMHELIQVHRLGAGHSPLPVKPRAHA